MATMTARELLQNPDAQDATMFRLLVDFESARLGVPATSVQRSALEVYFAGRDIDVQLLRDFYGKRAEDLAEFLAGAQQRGRQTLAAHKRSAALRKRLYPDIRQTANM